MDVNYLMNLDGIILSWFDCFYIFNVASKPASRIADAITVIVSISERNLFPSTNVTRENICECTKFVIHRQLAKNMDIEIAVARNKKAPRLTD